MKISITNGIIAIPLRTGRTLNISANLPINGIRIPLIPIDIPIMRLETKERLLGATFCANATAGNKVAEMMNPNRNEKAYIRQPVL